MTLLKLTTSELEFLRIFATTLIGVLVVIGVMFSVLAHTYKGQCTNLTHETNIKHNFYRTSLFTWTCVEEYQPNKPTE